MYNHDSLYYYILHSLILCRPTLPGWYSAGMTMTLLHQIGMMQCDIWSGVRPVLTSWEDFLIPHLSLLTHAPSPLESTMCVYCGVYVYSLYGTIIIIIGTQNSRNQQTLKKNYSGNFYSILFSPAIIHTSSPGAFHSSEFSICNK